jgi:hypothetical protein
MSTTPPRNPLTESDKDAFDVYLLHWQEVLGLIDWRIRRSRKKPAAKANMADIKIYHVPRMANVFLGDDFGGMPVTDESLSEVALHECLHVLLAELVNQVDYGIEGAARDSAEHRVVHVLEKLLLKGSS